MNREIPIACLSDRQRASAAQKRLSEQIAESLIDFEELENGFSYRFPLEETILQDLAAIIDLERKCCPFLNFKLILEAGNDFVSLELTGGQGTKEMIKSLFDWN